MLSINQKKQTFTSYMCRLVLYTVCCCTIHSTATAAVPDAAKNDPRYRLGYLVVTYYPGVDSTGAGDSRAGIQQALEDAYDSTLTVFFPPGEYRISNTLKCYKWQKWDASKNRAANPKEFNYVLLGSQLGTGRPVIKLAPDAVGFNDPANPRPLIVFRNFEALNATATAEVDPDLPLDAPANYREWDCNNFADNLRNIDFDCGGHSGAVGVYFPAAQYATIENVRVNATGATAGFMGIPGRNSGAANIEVEGGKIGLWIEGNLAGTCVVGAKFFNQTESAIAYSDWSPGAILGFHIRKNSGPVMTLRGNSWDSSSGIVSMIDGIIELETPGLAFDNSYGCDFYARNVFVKNTAGLVQSGVQDTVRGTGTWQRIKEYSYTSQQNPSGDPPYEAGDKKFRSFNIIDGVAGRTPEPSVVIQSNIAQPPADILSRHIWNALPGYEGQNDGTIVVTDPPYNADPTGAVDASAAIQQAIDDAASVKKVFIPRGTFKINTTITLHAHTTLLGAGKRITKLYGPEVYTLMRTDDDRNADTFLGFMQLRTGIATNQVHNLLWRAGRRSSTVSLEIRKDWQAAGTPGSPRRMVEFNGYGGGRHYHSMGSFFYNEYVDAWLLHIEGTTEPLHLYGMNVEITKNANLIARTNIYINNAENVNIYSIKREGHSPTAIIRDSRNIAIYSAGGCMRGPVDKPRGAYLQITGACDKILMTNFHVSVADVVSDHDLSLFEHITGKDSVSIEWPDALNLYKRGELDDIDAGIVTSIKESPSSLLPRGFTIAQNYPNPFNAATTFRFTLPSDHGAVELRAVDNAGRIITIYQGSGQAGQNLFRWSPDRLPSGIYHVQLLVDGKLVASSPFSHIK